eukprot:128857-Hanusia_phi.AAC.1
MANRQLRGSDFMYPLPSGVSSSSFLEVLGLLRLYPVDLSDYLIPSDELLDTPDSPTITMPLWDQTQTKTSEDKKTPAASSSSSSSSFLPFATVVGGEQIESRGGDSKTTGLRKVAYAREACQFCRQRKLKCDE